MGKLKYNKYFIFLAVLGWLLMGYQFVLLHPPQHVFILIILLAFLYLIEQYPIPVYKSSTSLSFPIVYIIYLLYGVPLTIITLSGILVLTYYLRQLPLKIILLKPPQIIISFFLAINISNWLIVIFNMHFKNGTMVTLKPLLVILLYYGIYILFVDIFLLFRSKKEVFIRWRFKALVECGVIVSSILYIWFMHMLGNQDRGKIDVLSYFFVFSPLTGVSLVISIIARLQREKNRLKSLFSITSNLNKGLTTTNWLSSIVEELRVFLEFDASLLFVIESNKWSIMHKFGYVKESLTMTSDMAIGLSKINKTTFINNRVLNKCPVEDLFQTNIHSLAYAPLFVENELVGVWVIGRLRKNQFRPTDIHFIEILANQISIVRKSRLLIAEQAKHEILEERNRIAREIHDGIAQSLAGVILSLETSQKKYKKKPNAAFQIVDESIVKLRKSLKEVRESIYALRPNPIKHKGLITAFESLIKEKKQLAPHIHFQFDIRGNPIPLSLMVEKILYEVCQEGLRNIIKHANASKVDLLLSFQQESVLLKIKDDGVGFSLLDAMMKAKNEPHFGILNINDFADKLGASLHIDSKPGKGTELIFKIPNLEVEEGDEND